MLNRGHTLLSGAFGADDGIVMLKRMWIPRAAWVVMIFALYLRGDLDSLTTVDVVGLAGVYGFVELGIWLSSRVFGRPEVSAAKEVEPHPHRDEFGDLGDDEACFADFENTDDQGRLRLDLGDFAASFGVAGKAIKAGALLRLSDGENVVDGILAWNEEEELWVAEIDHDAVRKIGAGE